MIRYSPRYLLILVLMTTLAVLSAACGDDDAATTTAETMTAETMTATTAAPTTTVIDLSGLTASPAEPKGGLIRIGTTPSYDDRLWAFAESIGMDTRIGLELELIPFPGGIPYTQMQTDEIDMLFSCQPCYGSVIENFPSYRNYLITNEYQGFTMIGRTGQYTYAQALTDNGNDTDAAKAAFAEELVGTEILKPEGFPTTQEESLLAGLGLTLGEEVTLRFYADITGMNFAFLQGEGDFYIGSLDMQTRLLFSDELAGEYVVAAPLELFGRSVLYSTEGVTQEWLDENPETALRSLAVWYRAARYLEELPDIVGEFVGEDAKASSGGVSLGGNVTARVMTELNYFMTLEAAQEYMFTPGTNTYFGNIEDRFISGIEGGTIPEGTVWSDYEVEEEWFTRLLAREDLVAWINLPLGTGVGPDGDLPLP